MRRKRINLPVGGMHCSSCAVSVSKALEDVQGVFRADVNVSAGRALVEYDPSVTSLKAMGKAVEAIGYKLMLDRITLTIKGMSCASCVQKVEQALREVEGVYDARVNLMMGKAVIEALPGTSVKDLIAAVRRVGYDAVEEVSPERAIEREKEERAKEIRSWTINLAISLPIAVLVVLGEFREYLVAFLLIPEFLESRILLFGLTTIAVFGPARQFFTRSARGLIHGSVDMNLLYAVGIGAAYIFSSVHAFYSLAPGFPTWFKARPFWYSLSCWAG